MASNYDDLNFDRHEGGRAGGRAPAACQRLTHPTAHSLQNAFATQFALIIVNNWTVIMASGAGAARAAARAVEPVGLAAIAQDAAQRVTNPEAWVFFVSFYVAGVMLLTNTIVSFLLQFFNVCALSDARSERGVHRRTRAFFFAHETRALQANAGTAGRRLTRRSLARCAAHLRQHGPRGPGATGTGTPRTGAGRRHRSLAHARVQCAGRRRRRRSHAVPAQC